MKEFIQKSANEVAIVIYDAPLPPKYFRLTKRFIKTLFIVTPLFLVTLFLLLFFWGLGYRLKQTPAPALPDVLSETESKILALEMELKDVKELNQTLSEKIALGSTVATDDPNLLMIKKPYGMQNLISQNRVSLDQIEFVQSPDQLTLKFQIIHSNPETRVSGYVMVFMISESGIMGWPKAVNSTLSEGVKFSMGDTFAVSRLRPTDAVFINNVSSESVKFMVYIFNREGDLLLMKETEPYKVGTKS